MKVSVWSHDANPGVDPRLCRKSLSSCEQQVLDGWLKWIDPADKTKGCIGTRRFRPREFEGRERKIDGATMRAAWMTKQSGYAGPLVLQMRSQKILVTA